MGDSLSRFPFSRRSGDNLSMDDWQITSQRPGSAGFMTVVTRTYDLPNGSTSDWDILENADAAAVLAITRGGDVVLVRQFRPGPGRVLDELPGGLIDSGETPVEAAARELLEETGYRGTIEIVGSCWLMGNSTRRQYVAVARDCERVGQPELDAEELCETVLVSLDDFRRHLRSGQLTDVDLGYLALDHLGLLGGPDARHDEELDSRPASDAQPRLTAQLAFVLDADRLKGVERRSRLADGSRRENSAEHSWHLALMAMVLAEHSAQPVDLLRVVQLVIVHDLVEIEAGDTFVYDGDGRAGKTEREAIAAQHVFGQLPGEQADQFMALWKEYEAKDTPSARFARALDRLEPLMLNHASAGATWTEHGITADRVREVNRHIEDGSATLWDTAQALITDAVARGYLAESDS
jgi:putative hydrolases of HD superfamily